MKPEKEEVVISGMAGMFPDCHNVNEFQQKLLEGLNLCCTEKEAWINDDLRISSYFGDFTDCDSLDYTFFTVLRNVAIITDTNIRVSLQVSFSAVCDAGVDPGVLSGTHTGVIVAQGISDFESRGFKFNNLGKNSRVLLGLARTFTANRQSFTLNSTGSSFSTWSSCAEAIQYAATMIRNGALENAIIVSTHYENLNFMNYHYEKMGRLNEDGLTKSFSDDADGYTRSNACVGFFLQKGKDALRSYARLVGITDIYQGSKEEPLLDVSRNYFTTLLPEFYRKSGLDPASVAYVEAAGIGIKAVDAAELNGLSNLMLGASRSQPLLVGSVKSNAGHAEGSADAVGIAKTLISLNTGVIPANINYSKPNCQVPALMEGKIQVVLENTPLPGDIVAVNALDYSGTFRHLVLKRHDKPKSYVPTQPGVLPPDGLPRLFYMSGRDENETKQAIEQIEKMPIDPDFLALTYNLFKNGIKNHMYKGFTVLNDKEIQTKEIREAPSNEPVPPVWYVCSGMGSQWTSMASDLMKLPVIAKSIERSHNFLKNYELDVVNIITSNEPAIFNNIMNSFVGITTIQIALIDLLNEIGLKPDGIIGHSLGETACAYADGCLSHEEALFFSYSRGKVSVEENLIQGLMAAVGKGYQALKDHVPEEIDLACHNSESSCTISGPARVVEEYVEKLTKDGVFARVVNTGNIPYHSRYIQALGPKFLRATKAFVERPKPRSQKWVSSSIPESEWDSELAKYASAEYNTNNLLSPVLFEEAAAHIPQNAIIIEIAPHGLLQAVLKKTFTKAHHIPLTSRLSSSGLLHVLSAIGRLYNRGVKIDIGNIYPPVSFPVPRGTPSLNFLIHYKKIMLSNMIEEFAKMDAMLAANIKRESITLDFTNEKQALSEYYLNGLAAVPLSAYMTFSIEELQKCLSTNKERLSFVEMSLKSYSLAPIVEGKAEFVGTSRSDMFYLCQGEKLIVKARLEELFTEKKVEEAAKIVDGEVISGEEFYDYLTWQGLRVGQSLQLIKQVVNGAALGVKATVAWNGDLACFLESLLLLPIFALGPLYELCTVTAIKRMFIDLNKFPLKLGDEKNDEPKDIEVIFERDANRIVCDGLEILHPAVNPVSKKEEKCFFFKQSYFMSCENEDIKDLRDFMEVSKNIVVSNITCGPTSKLNLNILIQDNMFIFDKLSDAFKNTYGVYLNVGSFDQEIDLPKVNERQLSFENYLIVSNSCNSESLLNYLKFSNNGYLLLESETVPPTLEAIISRKIGGTSYHLCHHAVGFDESSSTIIVPSNDWELKLQEKLNDKSNNLVYLVSSAYKTDQISIIYERMKHFNNAQKLRYIFHNEKNGINPIHYKNQLRKGLKLNVFRQGKCYTVSHTKKTFVLTPISLLNVSSYSFSEFSLSQGEINAIGLNTYDVIIKKNRFKLVEYSGEACGKAICGIGQLDGATKVLSPDPILRWEKPPSWTHDEIASVLIPYTLAYYIHMFATWETELSIDVGNRYILVHCGSHVFSQAIISVCLNLGYNVYTTYRTEAERRLIGSLFPLLHIENIVNCNTVLFLDELKAKLGTKGQEGFQTIVNTSSDPKMASTTMHLLGKSGNFYQVVPVDGDENTIGMKVFLTGGTVFGLFANSIPLMLEDIKKSLRDAVQDGILKGQLKPFSTIQLHLESLNLEALDIIQKNPTANEKRIIAYKAGGRSGAEHFKDCKNISFLYVANDNVIWIAVLEWIIKRGASNIEIVTDWSKHPKSVQKRLELLMKAYPAVNIHVESSVKSYDSLSKFIGNLQTKGTISPVFIFQKETDAILKAICDKTSDSRIIYFTSSVDYYLGSRATNALQIIDRWDLLDKGLLLPSLDGLMKLTENILYVEKESFVKCPIENLRCQLTGKNFMSMCTKDVTSLSRLHKKAYWKEVRTASLRAAYCKEQTPVFILTPLKTDSFQPLLRKLFSPAFLAVIPGNVSFKELTQMLYQDSLRCIRSKKDIFTLTCTDWSCDLGISLIKLLEENGIKTTLIVIDLHQKLPSDSIYSVIQREVKRERREKPLSRRKEKLLETGFELLKELISLMAESDPTPSSRKVTGLVALIRHVETYCDKLFDKLQENSESVVNLITSNESSLVDLVSSPETANAINKLTGYPYEDKAKEVPRILDINKTHVISTVR